MYHSFKRLSWVLEKPFEGTQQGWLGNYTCASKPLKSDVVVLLIGQLRKSESLCLM